MILMQSDILAVVVSTHLYMCFNVSFCSYPLGETVRALQDLMLVEIVFHLSRHLRTGPCQPTPSMPLSYPSIALLLK